MDFCYIPWQWSYKFLKFYLRSSLILNCTLAEMQHLLHFCCISIIIITINIINPFFPSPISHREFEARIVSHQAKMQFNYLIQVLDSEGEN